MNCINKHFSFILRWLPNWHNTVFSVVLSGNMEIILLCYVAFWCTRQVCNDRSMHDKSKTICLFREGLVALIPLSITSSYFSK